MKKTYGSSCRTESLSPEQINILTDIVRNENWIVSDAPYCRFKAKKENTSLALYESGKLVVQGAGTSDFVEFILEPRVLKCVALPEAQVPDAPFFPHAGIDESGKGDFFGPLCVACVFVSSEAERANLLDAGVRDSKLIKNDEAILRIARVIRAIVKTHAAQIAIGPETYNRLYDKIGNLNKLLAWGHARALENLLEQVPECSDVLADQFGKEELIQNALMAKGRTVTLRQQTKAESDVAVAAASILARADFVRRIKIMEERFGMSLPKGAGSAVDAAASVLVRQGGGELLRQAGKMHFRTAFRALGKEEPEKRDWRKH